MILQSKEYMYNYIRYRLARRRPWYKKDDVTQTTRSPEDYTGDIIDKVKKPFTYIPDADIENHKQILDFMHNLLPANRQIVTGNFPNRTIYYNTIMGEGEGQGSVHIRSIDPEVILNHRINVANGQLLDHILNHREHSQSITPTYDEKYTPEEQNEYVRDLSNYIVHESPNLVKDFYEHATKDPELWNNKDDLHERFGKFVSEHPTHRLNAFVLDYLHLLKHLSPETE